MTTFPTTERRDTKSATVGEIVKQALGEPASSIFQVPEQGNVNTSYFVDTRSGSFVVRVRFDRDEMRQFEVEKRCAELIRVEHDWTPAIVAIGRYGPHCYSIQERVRGIVASDYQGNLLDIWEQVGRYSRHFHRIRTAGYLSDLFTAPRDPSRPWCQHYFDGLGRPEDAKLVKLGRMTPGDFERGLIALEPLKQLTFEPTLAHGNLTLKNIVVEASGKAHIIDWGTCQGHLATELDISELLVFQTPRESLMAYLRGHGLPVDYIEQNSELLDRLRLARLFTTANWLCEIDSPRGEDLSNYLAGTSAALKRFNV
ncbi:MAG: aminoglycoside phosphotransferase family protein [Bdellovibrionota bacterium]|nr:MAG: aminoglycoside phosphotransferase family protein [Bdellovibrionota bacterium]